MASVFLSYDREDVERARPIAVALEKAGHSVWWDRHIKGGAQYGTEIEEALKRSDAVVVLWSARAVCSAWVRDEAAAGRDAGKLVPACLDVSNPPMGFRQYQTIDLSQWTGRRSGRAFQELDRAISGLTSHQPASTAPASSAANQGTRRSPLILSPVIAVVLIAAAAGAWMMTRPSEHVPIVAVAAADASPASVASARDLFVKLGTLESAKTDSLRIAEIGEGAGRSADIIIEVGGSNAAGNANANLVMLSGKDRSVLWSRDFQTPDQKAPDLRQQLAVTAGRVLECAIEALDAKRQLDQSTRKLFLNGCASLSELSWTDFRPLVPVFRTVTARSPKFEGGWAKLLMTQALMIGWEKIPENSPEGRTLHEDLATVRKLNFDPPEAYWAEYVLLPDDDLMAAAKLLVRAKNRHPDSSLILSTDANFLLHVGRMKEGVQDEKRATELEPLSPDAMGSYISTLAWAGQAEASRQELNKAESLWPGTRSLLATRWRYHLRYGDPDEALKMVRSGVTPDGAGFESYLSARINPTAQNVDKAVADAAAQIKENPRAVSVLVQTLAEFGREKEIFAIMEGPAGRQAGPVFAAFFRPAFRRFRQDPRFMQLAKRYGQVDYWRASGKWPDFCFEPDLPYDCKAEAARLAAA